MNSWTLPPELAQTTPRCVKIDGKAKLFFILSTVATVALMVWMIWLPYDHAHEMAVLKAQGVSIEGEIVRFHSGMTEGSHPQQA